MILPLRVLGRSALKTMRSGRAMPPILRTTCSFSSPSSSGETAWPSLRVMKATMAWPLISWAMPTTAASATDGWSTSALSTSIVPMRWPETFSTSSTRPSSVK